MARLLLISYDNESHLPFFPINLFYLTGHLHKQGHQVGIWFQDLHHGNEDALTKIIADNHFDVVGLGFVAGYYQYRKAKKIADVVNSSTKRGEFQFVLGGHGPAAEPEFFMKKLQANSVIVGDGEDGFDQLFKGKSGVIKAAPCTEDSAPLENYADFPIETYRLIRWPTSERTDFCMPILSSRGCKFHCSFCYRMREGYHLRSVPAIMEEIKWLHQFYMINHFQFADELLMADVKRTEEICQAILKLPFKIKWDCNGRLNYAKPGILSLMKKSGCEYINYGIESLNQNQLNQMHKGLTIEQILKGTENTLAEDLSPGLNLIWGFPGDSAEDLWKAVDFLVKYDPCHELRTIRPVCPYPGTELYKLAIEKGLLEGPEDFYENKHKNSDLFTVNFMDMPTDEAHEHLYGANLTLYENYQKKKHASFVKQIGNVYMDGDTSFRGFRPI